jgi:L-ascorbate metabolism protein UlaG (beta-lactamase superfamily)
MRFFPVFGKTPDGPRLERILQSSHYKGGSFRNLTDTEVMIKGVSFLKMMREYRNRPADTSPPGPLPSVRTDWRKLPDDQATFVWFGHSSYLLKIGRTHILVDPVFSGHASPVSFFAKAFPGTDVYGVEDMPDTVEALLLTHDHYDHLDYRTIRRLRSRVTHFYASLGVGAHLESWGIEAHRITELDWWESCHIGADGSPAEEGRAAQVFTLTATPARHFSGRGIRRGATSWSSFVLKGGSTVLFLGGDSGYEKHFREIGERFGPFDLAILECGQYGKNWPFIHMMPEETVQAAMDLRAAALLPVHWGKFSLSLHPWNEPVHRVNAAAAAAGLLIATPRIGQPVIVGGQYPRDPWYDFL